MRSLVRLLGLGVMLGAFAGPAQAEDLIPKIFRRPAPAVVECCPTPMPPLTVMPTKPGEPPAPGVDPAVAQPPEVAFGQPPPAGGAEGASFNPALFGDLIGTQLVIRQGVTTVPLRISGSVPLVTRGAYKITDNESPRPTDRFFLNYNYFNNVNASISGSGAPGFNMHREVIGFEKTFFDGNASLSFRLPILQFENGSGLLLDPNQIGDLTLVSKWAFYNDLETGNLISTGLAVTVPSGDSFMDVVGADLHSTLLQPYIGYIWNRNNFFVQGFSAVVVPTASTDATILFNDIGLGYWVYRQQDGFLRGIAPTVEGHLTTPLNHRGADTEPFGIPDLFAVTAGVNFLFPGNSTLGAALCTPLTGPRPYDLEAIVSFNFRF